MVTDGYLSIVCSIVLALVRLGPAVEELQRAVETLALFVNV